MPAGIFGAAAAVQEGFIYSMGGWFNNGQYTSQMTYNWRLNATQSNAKWDNGLTTIPSPVADSGAATVGNSIYLLAFHSYSYTPATDFFQDLPEEPNYLFKYPVVVSSAELAFIIGGQNTQNGQNNPLPSVQTFNTTSFSWNAMARMPTARYFSAGATDVKGLVHVVGGFNGQDVLSVHELFNPFTNSWATLPPIPNPVMKAAAAVIQDNVLFVIGGVDSNGKALQDVWAYDNASKTWSLQPSLSTPRLMHTAVAVGNTIFAMGGCTSIDCFSGLNSTEILNL